MRAGDLFDFVRVPGALQAFVFVQGQRRSSKQQFKTRSIALLLCAGATGRAKTRARLVNMSAKSSPTKTLADVNVTAGGCLYLVGTPIGNLEDITMRAIRILKEVDQIACEDTRHSSKLLSHYDIHKPLVSYHEHNELIRAPELVLAMEQGAKIALISDAGTPLVSDPGHRLVTLCLRHHIPVVPIPGPSALLASLSASGLPNEEFLFVGFLPARTGERRRAFERLRIEDRTIILYEAPHRIAECVADAREVLGNRSACIAREVTKLHEEFRRGKLSELSASLEERPARGEITLLIGAEEAGDVRTRANSTQSLADRVEELIHQAKLDRKEALKLAAKERGLTRRDAYTQLVDAQTDPEES
jgi:16S rRNA (cytidine1402-2'-O)-methyltransferase